MSEQLEEARRVVRVNSKGKKTRKTKCRKGFKVSSNGKSCVPISGADKAKKKRAVKKAVRTKKSKGGGAKTRANRKRLKAMRKRKSMNL
jgi:hypothetical protein